MLSSISSSNQRLPSLPWAKIWLPALMLLTAFVLMLEGRLALRDIAPTRFDSKARWQEERLRVKAAGKKALVLIGASRIQLGIDPPLLSQLSGMQTIQLAIDGSTYWPILQGLANDPDFIGTVVVDYYEYSALDNDPANLARRYESDYQQKKTKLAYWNFDRLENQLEWYLRGSLRSYADGTQPMDSLYYRVINKPRIPQYLLTHPDRSRDADYRKLEMPRFYIGRVYRTLGEYAPKKSKHYDTYEDMLADLQQRIAALPQANTDQLTQKHQQLREAVDKILQRGGKVIFLTMPTSGMIHDIENKQYPQALFWVPLKKALPVTMIHSDQHPTLKAFVCPDGAHLDYRDKARFTAAFAQVAGLTTHNYSGPSH